MKLIRKAEVVASVPEHWRHTYYKNGAWRDVIHGDSEDIYNNLISAQPLTEETVALFIGNHLWTEMRCDECRASVDLLVVIGQEPDYESNTARVCLECISKAHVMMITELKEHV